MDLVGDDPARASGDIVAGVGTRGLAACGPEPRSIWIRPRPVRFSLHSTIRDQWIPGMRRSCSFGFMVSDPNGGALMGILDWLLGRRDPSAAWIADPRLLLDVDLSASTVCGVRMGES